MRHWYLHDSAGDRDNCRGGVTADDDSGEYEVEIANHRYCSPEMMALMVHHDEIMEFLELQMANDSCIAAMLYKSINATKDEARTGKK